MATGRSDPPLPHVPDAEAAVLGSLLIDPDALVRVRPLLDPADFFVAWHECVYRAILVLHADGVAADMVTLGQALDGEASDADLTGLLNAVPTSVHAEHYARQVRGARVRRDLVGVATRLASGAYGANGDLPGLLAEVRTGVSEAERLLADGGDGMDLRQSLDWYLDLLVRRDAMKDRPKLAFPWRDLADLMPYLSPGELVGVLAESGAGKTAFLENCAEAWARDGWHVSFFHLELSPQMMLDRRMQRQSGVPIKRLQLGGQLETEEYERILDASDRMSRWPGSLRYVHCPGWPMGRIVGTAQKLHEAEPLDVVVVDYLNKVRLVRREGDMNAAQLRGQDIEDLKTAAEVYSWVALLAAQFDKASKHARYRTLADARDTGELQDKANVGIVIDRPRDEVNVMASNALVYLDKCNAGRPGMVPMYFRGERLIFEQVSGICPTDEV